MHYLHFQSKIGRDCSLCDIMGNCIALPLISALIQVTSPLAKLCNATIQNKKKKAVIPSFLEAFYNLHSPVKGWHVPQGLMIMKNVVLKKRNLS